MTNMKVRDKKRLFDASKDERGALKAVDLNEQDTKDISISKRGARERERKSERKDGDDGPTLIKVNETQKGSLGSSSHLPRFSLCSALAH
jgi:hypothetical protein